MVSPISVAEVQFVILTFIKSPIRWFFFLNTATVFCDVLPKNSSLDFLSLESWVDLVSLQEIDNKKSYLNFSPYQFMWISNKY